MVIKATRYGRECVSEVEHSPRHLAVCITDIKEYMVHLPELDGFDALVQRFKADFRQLLKYDTYCPTDLAYFIPAPDRISEEEYFLKRIPREQYTYYYYSLINISALLGILTETEYDWKDKAFKL